MTPVFSYWSSDKMQWMDGVGQDGQGTCASDPADACLGKTPSVSNFSIRSINRNGRHQDFNANPLFKYRESDAQRNKEEVGVLLDALDHIESSVSARSTTTIPREPIALPPL